MEDWLRENGWAAWLALSAVLGVGEMFSLDMVLGMLAVGAVVGLIAAVVGLAVPLQIILAGGGAVAMLALVRPSVVKRLHSGPELRLGHHKLIGTQGTVTQPMSGLTVGRVMLDGEAWTAAPYDDTLKIDAGETVEVLQIRGATAYVHPVPSLEI